MTQPPDTPALSVRAVSKSFGETVALADVGFEVRQRSVHALLGGNGSGKSTLVKILAGVQGADRGEIEVAGETVDASRTSPEWATSVGLHFVHQDLGVFRNLSVAENFALGSSYGSREAAPVRWRSLHRRAAAVLERFEIEVSTRARMDSVRPAMQTMIAVARALQDADEESRGVLVLDEPSAALPAEEVEVLHGAIRGYIRDGHTVVLVSHRLDEVLAICTDATFLRDGRHAGTSSLEGSDEAALIRAIVGADSASVEKPPPGARPEQTRLRVEGLSVGPVVDCTLAVGAGEVLGISGLVGSGRTSLLQGIFGARPLREGRVELDGEQLRLRGPAAAVAAGIAYLPEDRGAEAAFSDRSVSDNLAIPALDRYWSGLRQRGGAERRDAAAAIARYGVVVAGPRAPVSTMSGGNQQKVMLARWLELEPRLLLLDEPTQGVDVGARHAIHSQVRDAAAAGCAVIVVSSDAKELAELCDRVVGLVNGRLGEELRGPDVTTARCLEIANSLTGDEQEALQSLEEMTT
ncbi:MAG: sugar ABC transporter ATP-binding protein [Actinobacteria bacterium]|nr:sugar ABC transporter ATP-binding protein [Actinomycetota bacterium]